MIRFYSSTVGQGGKKGDSTLAYPNIGFFFLSLYTNASERRTQALHTA